MPGLYDDNDDYDTDDEQNSPKDLRAALAKANKEKKALEAKLAERDTTIATLSTTAKSATLRDAMRDAGIDTKFSKFVDLGDTEPSKEAVEKWAVDNKDVYAFLNVKPAAVTTDGEQDSGDEDEQGGPADELDQDWVNQILAGQQAETTGRPGGSSTVTQTLEGVDLNKVKSQADIVKMLAALGAPLG